VPSTCTNQKDSRICSPDNSSYDTCCDGACINVYGTDNNNCGSCGRSCGDGFTCQFGSCYPQVDCKDNADGTYCVSSSNVYSTCCEGKCAPGGTCGRACKPPDVLQSYSCVNPTTGASDYCTTDQDCPTGYGCVFGYCYQQTCPEKYDNGPCAFAGASGTSYGLCCGGVCTDYYNDSNNCGGCGAVCASQTTCQGGGCYGPSFGFVTCSDFSAGSCASGSECGAYSAQCFPTSCKGQDDGVTCAFGIKGGLGIDGTCCDGKCVATYSDSNNCGSCGTSCGAGVTCNYGYCLVQGCTPACPAGMACVNDACVGSVCDPGLSASSYYGPPACVADDGSIGQCCANGACEETLSDAQNCGGCGIQCPEGQSCKNGTCTGLSDDCGDPGRVNGFCDLAHSTTSVCCPGVGCTDVSSDSANCGGCGTACSQGQVCTAGVCGAPTGNAVRAP
jgi:hypothetical protein